MAASAIIEGARREGRTILTEIEAKQVLEEAGVPVSRRWTSERAVVLEVGTRVEDGGWWVAGWNGRWKVPSAGDPAGGRGWRLRS